MVLNLNISKEEEQELHSLSKKQGLSIEKIALNLLQEKLHEDNVLSNLNAKQEKVIDRRVKMIEAGNVITIDDIDKHVENLKKKYL